MTVTISVANHDCTRVLFLVVLQSFHKIRYDCLIYMNISMYVIAVINTSILRCWYIGCSNQFRRTRERDTLFRTRASAFTIFHLRSNREQNDAKDA
jgi:hypothetical protein